MEPISSVDPAALDLSLRRVVSASVAVLDVLQYIPASSRGGTILRLGEEQPGGALG